MYQAVHSLDTHPARPQPGLAVLCVHSHTWPMHTHHLHTGSQTGGLYTLDWYASTL